MTTTIHAYRGPAWWSLRHLRDAAYDAAAREVVAAWLALGIMAVGMAVLEARWDWSGMAVSIGGVSVPVTIYPPLAITLLLALWLGPAWGAIPAYLATFASATAVGMPLQAALLFALATPLELLIIWGSMVVLDVDPDLPRPRDVGFYLLAGVIAASASSLGGLIWIDAQQLTLSEAQRIWRGWLVGDALQIALLVPVMRYLLPRARAWADRRFAGPPRHGFRHSMSVLLVAAIVLMMSAVAAQGVWMAAHSLDIAPEARTAGGDLLVPRLREIALFLGLLLALTALTTTLFAAALARISEREGGAARRDALTGCLNRRAFYPIFEKEAERSRRLERGLSLLYVDVDHFKRVNDSLGHETGDRVLRQLAFRAQSVIREHDALFRWGGEEFLILLPHTEPGEAVALAERLRAAVANEPIVQEDVPAPLVITVSIGTAGATTFPADPDSLIATADAALLLAKRAGRNRVSDGSRFMEETVEFPVPGG
jgi:diguanylate cyclase